jgi:long-chain acyl-CoA synthetase
MAAPTALLPIAAAAHGGIVDGLPAAQLVAAGFTLLQRSVPLVRALRRKRSAILLPTAPQFFTALAASDGRGAVLINPLASSAEVAYQCTDADVGAVFTISTLARRVPNGLVVVLLDDAPRSAKIIADGATQTVDLGTHFAMEMELDADADGRDEECAIVYTSAMAGQPLGAVLTHRNLIANARQTVAAAENTKDDNCLAVLPFSHLFGLTVTAMAPLLAGGRVTTMARFNPMTAVDILRADGITEFVGVPAVFAAMLSAIERMGGTLSSDALRLCISGGAELPLELQDRWFDATGVELRQGYGLTECSPVCLFNRVSLPNCRGTLGVQFPGCEVTVRDPVSGAELAIGLPGEICIRGDTVFTGYVRQGSDGLQVRDGWLGSGDRGVLNANGTLSFRGLFKNMFTRNGFNVYPRELERIAGEMPGVTAAHVFAIPDPRSENEVGLEITGPVTVEQVRSWCEDRLAAYKQPSTIRVV